MPLTLFHNPKHQRLTVLARVLVLSVVAMVVGLTARAQLAEQSDTLYFNKKWELTTKKKHKFYRVTVFEDSLYVIKDYYANGQLQFEGTWLFEDTSKTIIRYTGGLSNDCAIGTAWYYYKNGTPSKKTDSLPLGSPCDITTNYLTEVTQYYKSGVRGSSWQEVRGKEHGTVNMHNEETGTLAATQEMKHGVPHGKRIQYYTDNTIFSVTDYVDGKKHGFYTTYYNYPFKPKYREKYEHGQLIMREEF